MRAIVGSTAGRKWTIAAADSQVTRAKHARAISDGQSRHPLTGDSPRGFIGGLTVGSSPMNLRRFQQSGPGRMGQWQGTK